MLLCMQRHSDFSNSKLEHVKIYTAHSHLGIKHGPCPQLCQFIALQCSDYLYEIFAASTHRFTNERITYIPQSWSKSEQDDKQLYTKMTMYDKAWVYEARNSHAKTAVTANFVISVYVLHTV